MQRKRRSSLGVKLQPKRMGKGTKIDVQNELTTNLLYMESNMADILKLLIMAQYNRITLAPRI